MLNYCVIGHPVSHSRSPKLHNATFRRLKIQAHYDAVDVAPGELGRFMKNFRERFAGANVTIPHKEKIMRFLDEIDNEARAIGAVNTIVNRHGRLVGYNTDMLGALVALRAGGAKKLRGKKIIVLGAGGAARAVIYGLKKAGAQVMILNRTSAHAQKLAREFMCRWGALSDFAKYSCDILINTTRVGMWKKDSSKFVRETPLPGAAHIFSTMKKKPIVMDIIYRPRLTQLLRDAKKNGCRIITGDTMFVAQAAQSFKLWTTSLKTPHP